MLTARDHRAADAAGTQAELEAGGFALDAEEKETTPYYGALE